jgi:hypothetical protein
MEFLLGLFTGSFLGIFVMSVCRCMGESGRAFGHPQDMPAPPECAGDCPYRAQDPSGCRIRRLERG